MTFEELGLSAEILRGVKEANFTEASPIQAMAIPVVLEGKDIIAQAQTGTGKTAAFGLPSMSKINPHYGVQLLVITPTRELCMQVSDELYKLGRFAGVKTVAVYGGQSISRQVDLIRRGATVVVATPGRLLDHLSSGRLENFNPQIVVLDEADEMLDMGFLDDIEEIFNFLPSNKQTLLFSATMPRQIMDLAQRILHKPELLRIESKETTNTDIEQLYYCVEERERLDALTRLIDNEAPTKALVFSRTKKDCDELATMLISKGYFVKALHGDLDQRGREEVVKAFRSGALDMVIATDVAARGLDVEGISHVFNYHIPLDPESYVHRIGRTGRAGRKGRAITIVTPLEFKELGRIKKLTRAEIYHEEIPTLTDLQEKHRAKMVEKIKHQPILEEAIDMLKSFEDDLDSQTLIYKLLSKILGKKDFQGANRIGLTKKMVEKIVKDHDRPGFGDRGGRGGGRGGYRGGNRSGGGGYRGSNDRNSSSGDRGGYRGSSDRGGDRNSSGGDRDRNYGGDRGGYRGNNDRNSSSGDRSASGGDRGGYRGGNRR